MNIYNISTLDGDKVQIRFFDIQGKVDIYEYDANWQPKDKGRELDPVDALDAIKRETGIGMKAVSPHQA